ncbi:hypothetical protein KSK37_13900 [Kaistella sp. DKR-2]|uniref:type II CRISPR RNA-guided endonuclease Cas9 n=1 Tax=Kaistella soli TaxID=2849654 RepID=UPI001C272AB4|nr:type II CRISPR RNA-guided endonuclease Cas9 [Kaistella soli]MBU8884178.1 hypothetical protein [Kaistella soli]
MKYKFILGLDIGTNSLGWSIIKEFENGKIEIVKTGVHIFPIGTMVDDKTGKEKTKNEQRRGYRGASRNRYRFKLRRSNLKKALGVLGMLPDFSKYHKQRGKGQSYELYKLRADAINSDIKIPLDEIGRIFMLLNKYRGFKSNAKKLNDNDKDAGVVKKGYEELQDFMIKQNTQTIGEYFFKMHEIGKDWYEKGKWHNPNEPLDERAFNENGEFVLFNSNGIRRHFGRYTLRSMYENEFDKIWAAQKNHYPEKLTGSKEEYDEILKLPYQEKIDQLKQFKNTNYWNLKEYCIYYQRPLKSSKRFVSNCQFERGFLETETKEDGSVQKIWKKKAKKACPVSNPLFQEFRIWQKLHQISYSSIAEDVFQQPLKKEWLQPIVDIMMRNYLIFLNKTPKVEKDEKIWISKILYENGLINSPNSYTFFIDKADEDIVHEEKNANKITGNVTYASFVEALGEEKFNDLLNEFFIKEEQKGIDENVEIKESKLFALWQTIYMAKDGLFKEDDWLMSYLVESKKWNLTKDSVERLIELGLQPDYSSYSSKVLKAILPEMRKGFNEYDALKIINKGYINEDNTIGDKVQLKSKISQLKYQELRNPVVEKAISKTVRLVNSILEKFEEITQENFEVRIESTRQLRKPRNEREKDRKQNSDKDKLREDYAKFLNENKKNIGVSREIYKNDSLIKKYELWLEMNFNEDDEVFKEEFKNFSKIVKSEDKLKHRLWLECGRQCPYTGKIINFSDLLGGNVQIEHIIPMSRSLDNSFNNKTLCYGVTNTLKGKMTPIELASKQGKDSLTSFKARINNSLNKFSDSKKKLFLAENVELGFSNNQLSNTSYIAKFARKKIEEVCKNVQFTNGRATAELRYFDWNLSHLIDKIRFEDETGINIDDTYSLFYRFINDFKSWHEKKYKTTDFDFRKINIIENEDVKNYIEETNNDLIYFNEEIQKFNEFRSKGVKKDRNDHRQHALDAFIVAACSPRITQILSTYYAHKEELNLESREKVEKNFDYEELKQSLKSILVSHSEKQSLIKKRINRINTKEGVKESITYAPQGKLHEESFYAKRNGVTVRRVKLFDTQAQEKVSFISTEKLNYNGKGEKWAYIDDSALYEITKERLEKFGKKAFTKEIMEQEPFFRASPDFLGTTTSKKGKQLPIVKSVRKRFIADKTLIQLPAKDEEGNIINENRYVDNETNAILVLYEKDNFDNKGKKKKPSREYELISYYQYVKKKRNGETLFSDEKNEIGLKNHLNWVQKGDFIAVYEDDNEMKIYLESPKNIPIGKIYKIKGITADSRIINGSEYSYGYVTKVSHNNRLDEETISHTKFNFIKIKLNILGEIECVL